jgi:hypothetical protein
MAEKNAHAFVAREEQPVASAPSQEDVAAYVATLARDLKRMVERHDLATLTYLLELVQMEASRNSPKRAPLDQS